LIDRAAPGTQLQMEPNMHAAQEDEHTVGERFSDPRLNPMINPRLGKNLGRWATVYYTSPPEKREQAVLELLRELEIAPTPEEEVKPPALVDEGREEQTATEEVFANQAFRHRGAPQRHFCFLCGSPLQGDKSSQPERHGSSPAQLPRLPSIERGRDDQPQLVGRHSVEIGMACEKRQSLKQAVLVLIISASVGTFGLWRMRVYPAAPQTASKAAAIPQGVARQSRPSAEFRDREARQVAPVQSFRDSSQSPSKPAAGTPIGCKDNDLRSCTVDELYRRTTTLADRIDALFMDYDKRVTGLLVDAKAHRSDSLEQQQNRTRQANYSAQLWERLQLGTYASSEKYDALKYRAELMQRAILPRSGGRRLVKAYNNPQSCLELHYIAEDLRRLRERLSGPETAIPPSIRRAKGNSLSR
jgi:hypothetical protein